MEQQLNLSEDEKKIYQILWGRRLSSSEIAEAAGFGRTKVIRLLNDMVNSGYVQKNGAGRGIRYFIEKTDGTYAG